MKEVEIRAKVSDFESIKNKLDELGSKLIETKNQIDRVFGHEMFLDDNHLIVEGGLSARIRETDNSKSLEFKEIVRMGGGLEIQSKLHEVEDGLKFLDKLNFEEAFIVAKFREVYKYKDFKICLDKVEKLGDFMEIERMVHSSEDEEQARQECLDLLKVLAPTAELIHKKYGDMMQELKTRGEL